MVPLRILYTINSSPQYILAKSTSPVKVNPVPYNPKYATTSLKASLDFICHSSPELLQHPERDFSVYILDPLESHSAPAPVSISTPSASTSTACIPTTGVAVALGLMSSARSPSTDIPVTGTLITLGTGQEALEVIFALRETTRQPSQSRTHNELNDTNEEESDKEDTSQSTSGPKLPIPAPLVARTEAEKLLTGAGTATYIGPPKRKVGRPIDETQAQAEAKKSKSKSKSKHTKARLIPPFVSTPLVRQPGPQYSQQNKNSTSSILDEHGSDSHVSSPPSNSQSNSEAASNTSLLHLLTSLSSDPQAQQKTAALLSVLTSIDSTTDPGQNPNPALVDALRQLLSTSTPSSLHIPNLSPPRQSHSHTDDEIVLLDKENVNPGVFRRRAEREREQLKLMGSALGPPLETENKPSSPSTSADAGRRRKRRLSDFMDERDAERGRKQSRQIRRTISEIQPQYPRPSGNNSYYRPENGPQTSPPRPSGINHYEMTFHDNDTNSAKNPISIPDSPLAPTQSSPIRRPNINKKPYVVPEWARTATATKPRLLADKADKGKRKENTSDITQAERERVRKRDRETARRRELREKERMASIHASEMDESTSAQIVPTEQASSSSSSMRPPPPRPFTSHLPVFASDTVTAFPSSSPPRDVLKTPPRGRRLGSPSTEAISLFTPTPKSRRSGQLGDGSPLFSPGPAYLKSPLGKRTKMSPTVMEVRLSPGEGHGRFRGRKRVDASQTTVEEEIGEEQRDEDDILAKELDTALQDLDLPSSSLPSSDVDTERHHTPAQRLDNDSDDDPEEPKQHWFGLPPSSPPPPTSPFLPAQDTTTDGEEMDDLDLLLATSDVSDAECGDPQTPNNPSYTADELAMCFDLNEFTSLFSSTSSHPSEPPTTTSDMDLFDQFTNHHAHSDSTYNVNDGLDVDLSDFDFTEFWESVKPLVDSSAHSVPQGSETGTEIDHTKLAEDVHALFSGCLM